MTSNNNTPLVQRECWYLVASKPKQEVRAVEQLNNQGISAFSPVINIEKIFKGKKRLVKEALFSGYLFVKISKDSPLWHKVRSTRGVRDWVKFVGEAAKIPDELINRLILEQSDESNQIVVNRFKSGQPVRILSGAFTGLNAIYEKDDGEMRAMILVDLLGKHSLLTVSNEQITNN
jgi:transcriptional antiterminator RfaH